MLPLIQVLNTTDAPFLDQEYAAPAEIGPVGPCFQDKARERDAGRTMNHLIDLAVPF